jgi:hypothetical protein
MNTDILMVRCKPIAGIKRMAEDLAYPSILKTGSVVYIPPKLHTARCMTEDSCRRSLCYGDIKSDKELHIYALWPVMFLGI